MVQVRKLVLAIAAASALTSGMAQALGLGEVSLKSSLNQPLVAEIELLEVRDLATGELVPSLASPEDFTRAGIDRQFMLNDLTFTPVIKANGKSYIRVTSNKPVREPYLNFLVEVLWPSGRLLREYTLLLDPPLYSPQTAAAVAPRMPVAAAVPRPVASPVRSASASTAPVAPASRPASVATTSNKLTGKEYKTTSSDTLWEIARRVPGGSPHQTMLAIQDLNPDAFIGGNINRLKRGQVLRLPDQQQINSRSPSEAIAQVNEQTSAWREGRSIASSENRQLDATKRNVAGAAPAKTEVKDSLQLVAAEAAKAGAGSDKGTNGDSKALNDKLQVTKESLDSTRRENGELKGRMTDLQSQLDKLQRLIQLKDDQLAKLQADLAAKANEAVVPATAVAAPVAEVKAPEAIVPAPAVKEPAAVVTSIAAPATEPVVDAQKPVESTPPVTDFNYSEEAAKPAEPVISAPVEPAKPVAVAPPAEPVKPIVRTVAPVAAQQEKGFFSDLMANPMLLAIAGGGGLLVLLVGLMMLSKRNAQKEAELLEGLQAEDAEALDSELELPESSFDGLDEGVSADGEPEQAPERVTAQTADPLGEADIYIAYGRFNQAAELLQNAVNDEPQRSDLRLKLLEVQAELGDREGFARQEDELREIGGVSAEVDQLKAKYPSMVAGAVAAVAIASADDELDAFSLDDLDFDEPTAAAPVADMDDAFDLSLDDLEAEMGNDLAASNAANLNSDFSELSLDGDFDLADADISPVADKDLSFDLESDIAEKADEDSFDLADFSLEMEADGPSGAKNTNEEFLLNLEDEPVEITANESSELSMTLPSEALELADDLELPADFDLSLAEETPAEASTDSFAAHLDEVTAELEQLSNNLEQADAPTELETPLLEVESAESIGDDDDDFDFLSGTDESATKLDLARAYIDMGDTEGARDILDEVVAEGSDTQQQEARDLIARLV
jgi:pilus assembly protein FimV